LKLAHKLIVIVIVPIILFSVLFEITFYFISRNEIIERYKEEAVSLISLAAQELRNPLYYLDLDGLEHSIKNIKQNPNIKSVYVMFSDGRIITDGTSENKRYNQTLNDDFDIKSKKSPDKLLVEIGKDVLHVYAPVVVTEKIGMVRADFSLIALDDILNNLIITLVMIGGIISIVIIIIGLFSYNSISKPIIKLRDSANEIAKGNFDVDIKKISLRNDEIGELSSQLDHMKDSISSVNKHLNRLVQERTKELEIANEELKQNEIVLKKSNEELKKLDRLKDEFISVASHELRTPIQPILGLSEVLHDKIKDTKQIELIDAIIRNAKRLQQLTEDILDVTKIESQSLKLNKERFNLSELISTIVEEYKNEIGKDNGNIKLVNSIIKDTVIIEADRHRISQVISNLIDNAIKFTKKGTITISIEKKDDWAIVSIKDTGTGIEPEIMPKLFSKFASKSYQGTGLGLFICKSIVEAHGGKIWAENNNNAADGKKGGATFSFTLSIIKQEQTINKEEQIDN
jgi:signal transduction histidine kinase